MIKDLLKDWKILLYLVVLSASIIYLLYSFFSIKIVVDESPVLPRGTEVYEINNCKVTSVQSFYSCIPEEGPALVKTSNGNFLLNTSDLYLLKYNTSVIPSGNIKLGTDIGGGYQIVLRSEEPISSDQMRLAKDILENRLNSMGIKALNIYVAGNRYIIIRIPSTEKELIEKIKEQGYFEARIKNQTIFTGADIINILSDPQHSGLECDTYQGKWVCSYFFTLVLSKDAAKNFANITKDIPVSIESGGRYLEEKIYFYLDGNLVSDLYIDANLKGVEASQVLIRVSGEGSSQKEAATDAIKRAKELQMYLGKGSLPSKFVIEEISYISPEVAEGLLYNILFAGLIALILLGIIVLLVFRNIKASLLVYVPMISEVIIAVAIGVLLKQTFDIPAILGVFLGIATGMDDNLIIVNDALLGKKEYKMEKSLKKVLFIIITAVLTEVFAYFTLLFLDITFGFALGFLRGFAVMTILTSLVGLLITRPAYVQLTFKLL